MVYQWYKNNRFCLIFLIIAVLAMSELCCFNIVSGCSSWDKSSIKIDGYCEDNTAYFIIMNTGRDMKYESQYRLYRNNILEIIGSFKLNGGESMMLSFEPQGDTLKLVAYQHSRHPGVGFCKFIIEDCGCNDCDDQENDNTSEVPDDNTSEVPDDNTSTNPNNNTTNNTTENPETNTTENPNNNTTETPNNNTSTNPNNNTTNNTTQNPETNTTENPNDNTSSSPEGTNETGNDADDHTSTSSPSTSGNSQSSNNIKTSSPSNNDEIIKENIAPIAIINIENNSIKFVNENILFDGSNGIDQDGYITEWLWNFGNNITATGDKINQVFDTEGVYTVTLTVVDNEGATNSTAINLIIEKLNSKPSKPIIKGPIDLNVNTNYTFIIESSDMDNDPIQFFVDWGDGIKMSTEFIENASTTGINKIWTEPGKYTISVQAYDGELYSESNTFQINVNEFFQSNYGYIILLIIAIGEFFVLSIRTALNDRKKALLQP